jgi:hypothetical protein
VVEDDDEADFVPKPSAASSPLETAAFEQFAAHVISRPDGIRSRAQGSATISAAATAAIAAFGGFSAVEDACELPDPAPDGPQITAELHPDDLTKPVVTLRIPRGHCRRGEPVTVRVRGTSIVATHRPPPDDARGTH